MTIRRWQSRSASICSNFRSNLNQFLWRNELFWRAEGGNENCILTRDPIEGAASLSIVFRKVLGCKLNPEKFCTPPLPNLLISTHLRYAFHPATTIHWNAIHTKFHLYVYILFLLLQAKHNLCPKTFVVVINTYFIEFAGVHVPQ